MNTEPIIDTLCRWKCQLNCWEWPDDFPVPMPAGFNELPTKSKTGEMDKFSAIAPYITALGKLVPHAVWLRYWNTVYRANPMTNKEYDRWMLTNGVLS